MIYSCSTKLFSNLRLVSERLFCLEWGPYIFQATLIKLQARHKPLLFVRIVFFSGLIFLFLFGEISAFTIAPEQISSDALWRREDGPFVIHSDVFIDNGARLTIESGTVLVVSGSQFIMNSGDLIIGNDYGEAVIIDSTTNLDEEYPELEVFTEEGEFNLYVYKNAEIHNLESVIPASFFGNLAQFQISSSSISGGEFIFTNHSQIMVSSSTMEDMSTFMLKGSSSLAFDSSNISGRASNGSIFNIFEGSKLSFNNSIVSPGLSDFALLLDNSILSATSTEIRDMHAYGIQATRACSVNLHDTTIENIFTPNLSSGLLVLTASRAHITDSFFRDSGNAAIELYQSKGVGSNLSMIHSVIENFGNIGISAVSGFASIDRSLIRGGRIGVENIFATTTITNSNISGNSKYGISETSSKFIVSGKNNFWGDTTGPYHSTNLLGKGNSVSNNVLFTPWLGRDPWSTCCSNVAFLPGLEASRLYHNLAGIEKRLWEPSIGFDVSLLFMDNFGQSLRHDIYARDVLEEALLPIIGPNIYKSFIEMMDKLRLAGHILNWLPMAYDWRLPLDKITSTNFIGTITALASTSKTGQVTLVAHSNGGLVAKNLMTRLSDLGLSDLIDKMIFIAVPQIGTPQAIGALLYGFNQSIPFIMSSGDAIALGHNMESVYNLIPSAKYFKYVFDPVIKFRDTGALVTSQSSLLEFLDQKGLNSLLLGNSKNTHDHLDDWLPPLRTKLIQIAGWGVDTLSGVEYFLGRKGGIQTLQYKPMISVDGDNTVVIPSALSTPTSTPNVERYWLDLNGYNKSALLNKKHSNILEVPSLRDFVESIIKQENNYLPEYISTTSPETNGNQKRIHFTLYSDNLALNLYDRDGKHTGLSTTTGKIEENVPESYYEKFGSVEYISLPKTIENLEPLLVISSFVGNDPGPNHVASDAFSLDVEEILGNEILETKSFTDLHILPDTSISIEIPVSILDIELNAPTFSNDQIIINQPKPMKISQNTGGQTRHVERKTTLRDIQSLIEEIRIPKTAVIDNSSSSTLAEYYDHDQIAGVYGSSMTMRDALKSIGQTIYDFLKTIWLRILGPKQTRFIFTWLERGEY
jgi:pimeloyl-ACP methyl ester carboxylesterase